MLTSERITFIASKLDQKGYLNINGQPSDLLEYFNSISSNQIQDIAKSTGIKQNDISDFINTTQPCISNITATFNNSLQSDTLMQIIFSSCFQLNNSSSCNLVGLNAKVFAVICSLAYIFMITMMLFTKRKFLGRSFCWGRPGCLVPVNMLDSYENRFGYTLSFGLTVSTCFSVIIADYTDIVGVNIAKRISLFPIYLSVLIKLVFSALISVSGAPFLICQSLKNQFVGGLIGLFLSLLWFVYEMVLKVSLITDCRTSFHEILNEYIFGILYLSADLPKYICLLLLLIKFIVMVLKSLKTRLMFRENGKDLRWMQVEDTNWKNEYVYKHVTKLLKSKPMVADNQSVGDKSRAKQIKLKLKSLLYENKPEFKYSLRILSTAFVSSLAIYIILMGILSSYEIIFGKKGLLNDASKEFIHKLLGFSIGSINHFIVCTKISIWLSVFLSVGLFFFVMVNSLKWYRFHILSLRKGDWSFLPDSLHKRKLDLTTPTDLMVASMKFAGYQVAYSVWGFLIINLLFFAVLLIITTQIFLPLSRKEKSFLLNQIISIWPTIVIGLLVVVLQKLLARFVLLIEKDTLAVDNRINERSKFQGNLEVKRIFHVASFFFFYFNIFIGIFSSFLRVIYGLIFGVLFFQRLQKSVLPRSYDTWDSGYMAYIGYILLEHHHANPVLQCFVRLLLEANGKQFLKDSNDNLDSSTFMIESGQSPEWKVRKNRVISRWHLYIILSQNPSLQRFRKVKSQPTPVGAQSRLFSINKNDAHDSKSDVLQINISGSVESQESDVVIRKLSTSSSIALVSFK